MRRLALLLLAACSSPIGQPVLEQRVVAAAEAGWEAAGLPEPGARCQLDRFEVRFPDVAEFDRLCTPGTTATVNGCLRWEVVERPLQTIRETITKPVAVIDPTLPEGVSIKYLALHELFHALVDCALHRPYSDPYDAGHTDDRVWVTATALAQEELR